MCFKIRIYITVWLIDYVKNRIQARKNWKLYCHSCSLILNQSLVMLSWNPLLPQVFWNTIILIFIFWNYISLPNKTKGLQDLKSWKSHFILQSLSQQNLLLCDGLMINIIENKNSYKLLPFHDSRRAVCVYWLLV